MAGCDVAGSSKAFAMHDMTPRDSDTGEEKRVIHVRNETRVVYHDAGVKL